MKRTFVAMAAWALTAALAAGPRVAHAQDTAAAEALFQQGRTLLAEGKAREACERFAQSQQLEPKLGTLLNLATCHETIGLTASAWAEFTSAATLAQRNGQAERETFARERVAALQARLSTLTVEMAAPAAGTEVLLDGKPYPVTGAPLPIDPGEHRVEARAPGRKPWSQAVRIEGERQSAKVVIPVLEDAVAPAPVAPQPVVPAPAVSPASEPPPPQEESGGVSPVAIVGFVIGGTGLLLGTITGAATLGMSGGIVDACGDDGVCPADQASDLDTANALATVSNVGFVLGGVGVGVGVTALLLSGGGDEPEEPRRRRAFVEPVIGVGTLGARGRF